MTLSPRCFCLSLPLAKITTNIFYILKRKDTDEVEKARVRGPGAQAGPGRKEPEVELAADGFLLGRPTTPRSHHVLACSGGRVSAPSRPAEGTVLVTRLKSRASRCGASAGGGQEGGEPAELEGMVSFPRRRWTITGRGFPRSQNKGRFQEAGFNSTRWTGQLSLI